MEGLALFNNCRRFESLLREPPGLAKARGPRRAARRRPEMPARSEGGATDNSNHGRGQQHGHLRPQDTTRTGVVDEPGQRVCYVQRKCDREPFANGYTIEGRQSQ